MSDFLFMNSDLFSWSAVCWQKLFVSMILIRGFFGKRCPACVSVLHCDAVTDDICPEEWSSTPTHTLRQKQRCHSC